MKDFLKYLNGFFIILLFTGIIACGDDGGSRNSENTDGDLLIKITPLVEASIPKYISTSKNNIQLKSWSDFSEGDDPHLARYLGPEDGCSLFSNVEFYDKIVDFINSKVSSDYKTTDSNVSITERTSLTIPVWGSTINGNFHDIDFGTITFTPFETMDNIVLQNIRVAVEKTEITEKVFIYIDVYDSGNLMTRSSACFEKNGNVFSYEERYFEKGSSGNDGEGHIYIEKADSGDFVVKRLYFNSNNNVDRAIVTGNLDDDFYIRVAGGSITPATTWAATGGTEAISNDECFNVGSRNFEKITPVGTNGSVSSWSGGVFPADVDNSNFSGFDVRDLINSQPATFQWWN